MSKKHLSKVLVSLLEGNKDQANQFFGEYLTELSKKTLGSYVKKASNAVGAHQYNSGSSAVPNPTEKNKEKALHANKTYWDHQRKSLKRTKGITKAVNNMVRENMDSDVNVKILPDSAGGVWPMLYFTMPGSTHSGTFELNASKLKDKIPYANAEDGSYYPIDRNLNSDIIEACLAALEKYDHALYMHVAHNTNESLNEESNMELDPNEKIIRNRIEKLGRNNLFLLLRYKGLNTDIFNYPDQVLQDRLCNDYFQYLDDGYTSIEDILHIIYNDIKISVQRKNEN